MLATFRTFLSTGLDLLYPRTCNACGEALLKEERALCWECRAGVTAIQFPFCSCCGRPVEGAVDTAYTCFACSEERPHYVSARSAVRLEGCAQSMVHDFKYRDALWLERELVQWMVAAADVHYADHSFDVIVPVPLHAVRLRERGYNQARLLAKGLGRRAGLRVDGSCLRRLKPTVTQTHLTGRERAHNVRGAFRAVSRRVAKKRILLVDDVMTTGATLNECARALKEGGAASVYVLTLARGGW